MHHQTGTRRDRALPAASARMWWIRAVRARAPEKISVDLGTGHARARRITADDHRLLGPRRLVRRAQFTARVLRPAALSSVTETYLSHISVIVLPCNNIC